MTASAMNIALFKPTLVYTIYIAATPPQKV